MYFVVAVRYSQRKKDIRAKVEHWGDSRDDAFRAASAECAKWLKSAKKEDATLAAKIDKILAGEEGDSALQFYKLGKVVDKFAKLVEGTNIQEFDCVVQEE
jgi:hypothetical protein